MNAAISIEDKLRERIKELTCLYSISSILSTHTDAIDTTLLKILPIVREAWLYPEQAVVEIQLNGSTLFSEPLPQKTVFLVSYLETGNGNKNYIKVHYPSNTFTEAHFLEEEKLLLHKIASEITAFLNIQLAKEKEHLLNQRVERNDRLAILGEITAGIAHELNTPLANILGYAELLLPKLAKPDQKEDTHKIIKSSLYAREVLKKLMFFTCEMPQNRTTQKLKPLVEEALAFLGPNFKKAQLSCIPEVPDKDLELKVDRVQFMQLLFNLLINAIYASPPKTTITVKLFGDGNNVILEITDQGSGIAPELKDKIFEPFFTTKPPGQGSGLGLSVVHGIVKSHQGEITFTNNSPQGTLFRVTFPIHH